MTLDSMPYPIFQEPFDGESVTFSDAVPSIVSSLTAGDYPRLDTYDLVAWANAVIDTNDDAEQLAQTYRTNLAEIAGNHMRGPADLPESERVEGLIAAARSDTIDGPDDARELLRVYPFLWDHSEIMDWEILEWFLGSAPHVIYWTSQPDEYGSTDVIIWDSRDFGVVTETEALRSILNRRSS